MNSYYVEGGKNYADDTPEMAKKIRDVLRDKRFRQALSMGIDRQRMIDVAWNGVGEAKQATLSPQSPHFASAQGREVYRKWAAAYVNFDAAAANALLDEMGMKKGADGFRTLPSGEPFVLSLDISDWGGSLKVQTDAAAEAEKQWETNLGISVDVKNLNGQPDLDIRNNNGYFMLRAVPRLRARHLDLPGLAIPDREPLLHAVGRQVVCQGQGHLCGGFQDLYDGGVKPEDGSPAQKLQALYEKGVNEPDPAKPCDRLGAIRITSMKAHLSSASPATSICPSCEGLHAQHPGLRRGWPWAPATPGNTVAAQWWMDK